MDNGTGGLDPPEKLREKIKALEAENRLLNRIIHRAPIPIFVLDKDHNITHFNQALEDLAGFSAGEMVGTDAQWKAFYARKRPVMADLIIDSSTHEQITAHYGAKYDPALSSKNLFAATDFFADLPPEGRWLFFTAAAITDDRGDIVGAVETLQDVTREKTREAQIKELFRVYRRILEFVPYPIVVYDETGRVTYINPSFTATFGWALSDIKGKPLPFVPEHLKAETRDILNRFRRNEPLTRYETQRLTRDGQILDVVIWAASHERYRNDGREYFFILRDITKEKRLAANNRTILRISAALPQYPDLEDLMDYISHEVKNLLDTEGAVVLLYDEIKNDLFFLGAAYDDSATERRAREFRFTLDEVFAGRVMKTGQPAMDNHAKASAPAYTERDKKLGYETRSILCVPIKSEGRIIGVLCAMNKKRNRFDGNDRELMEMIAGTVAISIENARFSEALKNAYRDVAAMNRAKDKAINHLSHELKTPVAVLTGSLHILKKKFSAHPGLKAAATLDRIQRNMNRIVEIQEETADIMDRKTYDARNLILAMLATCRDEMATLLELHGDAGDVAAEVARAIDREFGLRSLSYKVTDVSDHFRTLFETLKSTFHFRKLEVVIHGEENLPRLKLPKEVLNKIMTGLLKNAVENTPDQGRIDICIRQKAEGVMFELQDFGVGIETEHQKLIFEGFFSTQDTLSYTTKSPFEFGAGGKGADLLRIKLFCDRLGFTLGMSSQRCKYLLENPDETCPGDILRCRFCRNQKDCLESGHSVFSVYFPGAKK